MVRLRTRAAIIEVPLSAVERRRQRSRQIVGLDPKPNMAGGNSRRSNVCKTVARSASFENYQCHAIISSSRTEGLTSTWCTSQAMPRPRKRPVSWHRVCDLMISPGVLICSTCCALRIGCLIRRTFRLSMVTPRITPRPSTKLSSPKATATEQGQGFRGGVDGAGSSVSEAPTHGRDARGSARWRLAKHNLADQTNPPRSRS